MMIIRSRRSPPSRRPTKGRRPRPQSVSRHARTTALISRPAIMRISCGSVAPLRRPPLGPSRSSPCRQIAVTFPENRIRTPGLGRSRRPVQQTCESSAARFVGRVPAKDLRVVFAGHLSLGGAGFAAEACGQALSNYGDHRGGGGRYNQQQRLHPNEPRVGRAESLIDIVSHRDMAMARYRAYATCCMLLD